MTAGVLLLLGIAACVAVAILVGLMRTAGREEDNRRAMQKALVPHLEGTVTQACAAMSHRPDGTLSARTRSPLDVTDEPDGWPLDRGVRYTARKP